MSYDTPWLICGKCDCVYRRIDGKCGACGVSDMFGIDWDWFRAHHSDMPEVPEVGCCYPWGYGEDVDRNSTG